MDNNPWYSLAIFSIFDYIFFNTLGRKDEFLYRGIQVSFQIVLSILTYLLIDFKSAILFNLLWWTWNADWLYYLIDCILTPFKLAFEGWGITQVFKNQVTWAYWTPLGLLKGAKKEVINWQLLLIQSLIGIVLTFLIMKYV